MSVTPPRTTRLADALKSAAGAIDLASIMVGVIVIGTIAGAIAATLFAIIPWSQAHAAKIDLGAVQTAEGVALVKDGRYMNIDELVAAGYLNPPKGHSSAAAYLTYDGVQAASLPGISDFIPKTLGIQVSEDAGCFVAAARAGNGDIFYVSSAVAGIRAYDAATADTIVPSHSCASVVETVVSLGASGSAVSVVSASLMNAFPYTPYTYTVLADGDGDLRLSASGLPNGLTMTPAGLITGTPTVAGSYNVTITAANEAVSSTSNLVLNVVGQTSFAESFADMNLASRGVTIGSGTSVYCWEDFTCPRESFTSVSGGVFQVNNWVQEYSTAGSNSVRINMVIRGLVPNHAYTFSAKSTNNFPYQSYVTARVGGAYAPAAGTKIYTWTATTDANGSYALTASASNPYSQSSALILTLSELSARIVE